MGIISQIINALWGRSQNSLGAERRLSESDEQVALMCIQSCFRVVNESIEIARKSKNIETKLSRLGVARDKLKEALRQANQFALKVDGFAAAEAEINRIDDAIKSGTPTEIAGMPHIEINDPFASPARDLLKDATALKKEKKYAEACDKLREAYSAEGAENLMIEERLRLPMYLQLAGKNNEGWDELNRLYVKYIDVFSQPIIEHQMKIFLRKEKNESALNPVRVILPKPISSINDKNKISLPVTWVDNEGSMVELVFSATMQLRTPLRVLLWHGKANADINTEPPKIAIEMWEGFWLPKLKGEYAFISKGRTAASDIGPISPEDYLPFLIVIREVVERSDSIDDRIQLLREKLENREWQNYVGKHGGIDKIINYFFPLFIDAIPKVNSPTAEELSTLGLDTPNSIASAPDETLLGIKGIGQSKLKAIRDYCASIINNRDAKRLDSVIR